MLHEYKIPCLDLAQIAQSGQCFRMIREEDGERYRIISRGRILRVSQSGETVIFDCEEQALDYWLDYFDFHRDYSAIIRSVNTADTYLLAAAQAGCGIRILRQDPWEMIITFVISQQKTIPKIRELVEALSARYGAPLTPSAPEDAENASGLYAFPTPDQLAAATLQELQELKLGYRAKYIHKLARDGAEGILDISALSQMSYEKAMDYLTGFYGIGKKVANCVCLFGLHHVEAFPVDTWIEKILMEQYYTKRRYGRTPKTRLYDKIIGDHFGRYEGCAGIMQQYIFNFERNVRRGKP